MLPNSTSIAAVVTPCSARKSAPAVPELRAAKVPKGSLGAVATEWRERLRLATPTVLAADLYRGRAFQRSRNLAEEVGASLYVVSAGLGLVRGGQYIPSYDLTLTDQSGAASIARRVRARFSAEVWWSEVSSGPFAESLEAVFQNDGAGMVLIALSRTYASMLLPQLEQLGPAQRRRIRLFGAIQRLPAVLAPQWMPYDGRLDTLLPGAKVDFAQRAMAHFASAIRNSSMSVPSDTNGQRQWVLEIMDSTKQPHRTKRRPIDDRALAEHVRSLARSGMSFTRILRHLRDSYKISCGESRLMRTFQQVRPL